LQTNYDDLDQPQKQGGGEQQIARGEEQTQPGKMSDFPSNVRKQYPTKKTYNVTPSRRPSSETERNQYEQDFSDDEMQDVDRKYPNQKYPTRFDSEDSDFEDDGDRKQGQSKGTSRRPYEQDDEINGAIDDYAGDRYESKNKGTSRQPITRVKGLKGKDSRRPVQKITSKRPQSFINEDEIELIPGQIRNDEIMKSTSKPDGIEDIDYTSEDYENPNQASLRPQPNIKYRPLNKVGPYKQTISKTRRPNRPGLRVDDDEETTDYTDDNIDSFNTDSDNQNYVNYGTTPGVQSSGVSKFPQRTKPQKGQETLTTKVPQIYSTKYAATQGRPEKPDLTDEDINIDELEGTDKAQYGPDAKPTYIPRVNAEEDEEYVQQKKNKTGYQYIPPRTKFGYDDINKFPGKVTINAPVSTTRRPSQQTPYYGQTSSTGKPLVTAPGSNENVYGEDVTSGNPEYYEQQYHNEPNRKTSYKYNEGRPIPGQSYDGKVVSTRPSGKPVGSTYGPGYQTTRRPQYNQFSQTPGYETTPSGTLIPNQQDNIYRDNFSTRRPLGSVSSTTLAPSRRPTYYGTTQGDIITPGQQNVYNTDGTRKPGVIFGSTTPLPSQGPTYRPEGGKPGQFSTTYRTMEPVNPTNDYSAEITASRLPTAGPTSGPSAVTGSTKIGTRIPSTTYRPNYTIVGKDRPTARPNVVVDKYGRPVVQSEEEYNQQYPSEADRNVPGDNQNTRLQYQTTTGGARPFGYQSTTERIIGEDFSGPKQQQKFDPETGYYY
jgi:hypothetical protein